MEGGGGVVIRGRRGEHTGEEIAYNPIDEFRHYFKHFGRLLEKFNLFLTPSKTDGSVTSQQGAPTTWNLTHLLSNIYGSKQLWKKARRTVLFDQNLIPYPNKTSHSDKPRSKNQIISELKQNL